MSRSFAFSAFSFVCLLGWCVASSELACAQAVVESPQSDWSDRSFWSCADGRPVGQDWQFNDGEVRLNQPRGGSGSIVTGELPTCFELSWQFKIAAGTNSGVKYRVGRFGGRLLGVEYQIIDDPKDTGASKNGLAAIYDLAATIADKKVNPPGQWNDARVVATADRLTHFLNGVQVASIATGGAAWDYTVSTSKFYPYENFGQPTDTGRFMLTDHGGKASYRKFHFTALGADESTSRKRSEVTGPYLGNGIRNSWCDQNSIVLWTRTTASEEMNADGPKFLEVSRSKSIKLSKSTDADFLNQSQLPEGVTSLDEMFGACPGEAGEVRLTYFADKKQRSAIKTDWAQTAADSDFTHQWKLDDLKPGATYYAVVESRPIGSSLTTAVARGRFQTPPTASKPSDVSFCVTTCHDFGRRDNGMHGHKIYPAMTELKPDFVVHAGDIEYYDKPSPWAFTHDLMRFKWSRLFALPSNREFYRTHTTYFIKDDHDTLKNDCWPGTRYGSVTFEQGLQIFNEEQFPSHPRRYKTIRWGRDVQVWILEGRDYRSSNNLPDGPDKTILGAEQKAWLFETLEESDAAFKLVFSPTPIVGPDRDNKSDNHANDNFIFEGNQIRERFSHIDNLIVLCGDRHWQYASVDQTAGIWEFGCGPGSEKHQLGWKPGDSRPNHKFLRVAGGFLSGTVSRGDDDAPQLRLRHRSVTGEPVSDFVFPVPKKP